MVHRDPETGQFTSGTGMAMAERFTDYEFQHVQSEYRVPAADLPGAFPIDEEDLVTVELDDVLHRDERADLVAVRVHSLQASIPGTASAETGLDVSWELSLGAGSEMIVGSDKDFTADDAGTSGVMNIDQWQSDSPDVLAFYSWIAEGGFADSTNGLGGGPDQPVITDDVHYPAEYGTCPELDDRDEITESLTLNDTGSADISDSLVIVEASYSLVFAVHEEAR